MESTTSLRQLPPPVRGRAIPRVSDAPVYLAVALGYLMLMPPQSIIMVGGSALPPYRLFLILAALYVLGTAAKGKLRFSWPDFFVGLAVAWICLAMSLTSSAEEAFTASVAHIADIGLAYFFARVSFQSLRDLRMFLLLLLPGLFVTGCLVFLESVTSTHIVQQTASKLLGKPYVPIYDHRLGLMRAQGPFAHPISAGLFLGSFLPLYWMAGFRGWVKTLGTLAALGSFFSVSSAALLALTVSGGLILYNWLTQQIANVTWRLFIIGGALFVFVAELGTGSGTFGLLMRFGSLNSTSGYARINIWNFGTQNVVKHPWFGLGYGDWERPVWLGDSVDNYWLLTAMRFGLLPSVCIVLATFIGLLMIMRKSTTSSGFDQRMERGVAMAMFVFAIGLISVAVWLSVQVWYFALLGLTVSLATSTITSPSPLRSYHLWARSKAIFDQSGSNPQETK